MLIETVDKFCIVPWSNLSIECVTISCRICGNSIDGFEKAMILAGFSVEFTNEILETTNEIYKNLKTLFVYVKES